MSDHIDRFHRTPSFQCTECEKKSKLEYYHKMYMKIHEVKLDIKFRKQAKTQKRHPKTLNTVSKLPEIQVPWS